MGRIVTTLAPANLPRGVLLAPAAQGANVAATAFVTFRHDPQGPAPSVCRAWKSQVDPATIGAPDDWIQPGPSSIVPAAVPCAPGRK